MTQQLSDRVTFRRPWSLQKRTFALAATTGTGLYHPSEHDMTPADHCTGLYRGFLCEYELLHAQLRLRELYVFLDDWEPEIAGRFPHRDPDGLSWSIYRDVWHPIAFTGGMLIGRGFVKELWWRAGDMAPAWLYSTVYELVFESGRLVRVWNRSRDIARYRAEFADKPLWPENLDACDDLGRWHRDNYTIRLAHDYDG